MQQYFTCCIYILEHCCIKAREILLFINNYFCFSKQAKRLTILRSGFHQSLITAWEIALREHLYISICFTMKWMSNTALSRRLIADSHNLDSCRNNAGHFGASQNFRSISAILLICQPRDRQNDFQSESSSDSTATVHKPSLIFLVPSLFPSFPALWQTTSCKTTSIVLNFPLCSPAILKVSLRILHVTCMF